MKHMQRKNSYIKPLKGVFRQSMYMRTYCKGNIWILFRVLNRSIGNGIGMGDTAMYQSISESMSWYQSNSIGGLDIQNNLDFDAFPTNISLFIMTNSCFALTFFPAGGVIASIVVVICLFWVGLVDKVGFQSKGTTLNLTTLPVAIGLYGYCYSGHAVFPNIYTSMEKPSQYPAVLLTR